MQGVINRGTGSTVRKLGFTAPAAGKTGTEHDAWFAAYTSNLLCVVWIGNDDYSDIKIQGADAAAPIWADFMKRAIKLPQYSDMKAFQPPPNGVQNVRIDRASNLPADESCPSDTYEAAFLIGTVPQSTCSHMGMDTQTLGTQLFGDGTDGGSVVPVPAPGQQTRPQQGPGLPPSAPQLLNGTPPQVEPKHRNAFQKMFGLGKPKPPQDDNAEPPRPPDPQ